MDEREMSKLSRSLTLHQSQIKQMGLVASFAQREIESSLAPLRNAMKSMQWTVNIPSISVPFELQQSIFLLQDQMKSLSGIHSLTKDLDKLIPAIDTSVFRNLEHITSMERALNSSFSKLFETMKLPSVALRDSLATMAAMIKTYDFRPEIALEMVMLPNAYARYSERQIGMFNKLEDSNHPLVQVIENTLEVADTVILDSTRLIEGVTWGTVADTQEDNDEDELTINLFPSINNHLAPLYAGRIDINNFNISETLPFAIHRLGCKLIELICNINEMHQAAHGVSLFTPTQKMMKGILRIPNTITSNEMLFSDIVDYLYFMLYEGSGNAQRLLMHSHDEELSPLWSVKHLRLNWRHDLEHGKDISKKLMHGGTVFKSLIGHPRPRTAAEWKQAQLRLYDLLGNMLNGIYRRMMI